MPWLNDAEERLETRLPPADSGALISPIEKGVPLPRELKSKDEFQALLASATEVRIARRGDGAKVKLRTKEGLFTFKTTGEDADALVKGTKVPVVEF